MTVRVSTNGIRVAPNSERDERNPGKPILQKIDTEKYLQKIIPNIGQYEPIKWQNKKMNIRTMVIHY